MRDNNLFASVVLFRELYDNDKDIYDVIAEFISAAISYSKKWSFTSTEITKILEDTFDFNIPESVIKTTIKNRLLKDNILGFEAGLYTVLAKEIINKSDLSTQISINQQNYQILLKNLTQYFEKKWNRNLLPNEISELADNFNAIITDERVSDKYAGIISSFIIDNQDENGFTEKINAIKEGLILYNGIRYTSNLNELGNWNSDLTIYLDTEHLFNAVGLNGLLYKQLFEDFYSLVEEINRKNKTRNIKIELKYFPEIKAEVDSFFYVAECIVNNKANLDPSKTAMLEIINGCKLPSDVINKKTKFYAELQNKKILCDIRDYPLIPKYNVEDPNIIESLRKFSEENKKELDENECYHFLRIFTKINTLRRGISNKGFEQIGAILMSGKSIAHFIARNKIVKFQETDIPFATDIDFITNKFWFKLKKGLSNKTSVPKSFDIVTKAQVVLSTQINNSVSEKYANFTKDYKTGKITKEETSSYHHELRNKVRKPEEIVPEIIDESLSFLSDTGFESFLKEKSFLEHKIKVGEEAIIELNKIKSKNLKSKIQRRKKYLTRIFRLLMILFHLFLVLILIFIVFALYKLITPQDTWISILGLVVTTFFGIIAYVSLYKKLISRLKIYLKFLFKKEIIKIMASAQHAV